MSTRQTPQEGQVWQYEDMANQNTNPVQVLGTVTHTVGSEDNPYRFSFTEYRLRDMVTGEERTSDMRQRGWRRLT